MGIDSHRKKYFENNKVFRERIKQYYFKKISHIRMENAQGIWVLYGALLTLNSLNADKKTTAAETLDYERNC